MIKRQKYLIAGVFGREKIDIELFLNSKSDVLYILLHGAYGKVYHTTPTKYQKLSQALSKNSSVGFYQTSRWFMQKEKPDLSYDEYREQSFGGKQFLDEWEDVQRGVSEILNCYIKTFGKKPKKIICIGFSLGGLWSIMLSKNMKLISDIYMFGSGIKFMIPKTFPLFKSFPSTNFFASFLSDYIGNLHIFHGSQDELTSQESALKLFNLAQNSSIRSYAEWLGVDHQFSCINGVQRENKLIKRILKVI
jgi:hypothetical protein